MANKNTSTKNSQSKRSLFSDRVKRARRFMSEKRNSAPHKSFALSRRSATPKDQRKISGGLRLLGQSVVFYRSYWKLFLGLSLVYMVTLWVVVGIPNHQAYNDLKGLLSESLDGGISSTLGVSTLLLGAVSGLAAPEQGPSQQLLGALTGIVFWLVFVWAVRHVYAGNSVTIRETLYNASTPLIPLLTILFIIILQLIPASIGALIINYAFSTDTYGVSGVEAMLFSIAGALLILLSIYFVLQSLIALIIVTLPNMYPLAAMANAKTLVANRRLTLLLRLMVLALVLSIVWIFVVLPVVYIDTFISGNFVSIVPFVIDILSALTLPIAVIYLYRLYRELL